MKRRKFLGSSITGIAAAGLGLGYVNEPADSSKGKIRLSSVEVPLAKKVNVIVCGGGPAGFAAAVSAARNGASVRLIELQGFLGGVWTAGLMTHFLDAANKPGIMKEVLELQKYGGALASQCDVEVTKLWLENLCLEAGVELLYHTRIVDAIVEKGRLSTVITENINGRQAWPADIFIDTTGNGDLAARSGCKWDMGHPETGQIQPLSLNLLVTGIRLEDLQERKMIRMPGLSWDEPKDNLLAEVRKGGADCSYSKPTFFAIRNDFFSLMSNHEYKVNVLDATEITKATLRARKEVHQQIDALRSLGGMWNNIRIIATAGQIGIREARRIHGLYTVNIDDMIKGARFDDAVCRVTFGIDIHALDPDKNKGVDPGFKIKPYDIPLRSLIAKDVEGLMMAGRCISGDFFAHSSYRVTGNAVMMGEVAGIVAAKAAREGKLPREVEWKAIK